MNLILVIIFLTFDPHSLCAMQMLDSPPDLDSMQAVMQHQCKPPKCFREGEEELIVKKKKTTVSMPTMTQSSTSSM
jgi:hypothetical protein